MESENSVKNYNNHETGDCLNNHETGASSDANYTKKDATTYFRNLSLAYFVEEPLEMLTTHAKLKERCLEVDNPEAHYIEGVIKYFVHKEIGEGLYHLRQASMLDNINGTYLYGILMLALGEYNRGKKFLDKLNWYESMSTTDQCFERVKNALRSIPDIMIREYHVNMVNFEPRSNCNKYDDMFEVCKDCYHYKRLYQFVQFAIDHDD